MIGNHEATALQGLIRVGGQRLTEFIIPVLPDHGKSCKDRFLLQESTLQLIGRLDILSVSGIHIQLYAEGLVCDTLH